MVLWNIVLELCIGWCIDAALASEMDVARRKQKVHATETTPTWQPRTVGGVFQALVPISCICVGVDSMAGK